MRRFLIQCLILNLTVLLASGALLRWYPKQSGFTITTAAQTNYIPGGVFLGYTLVCLFDLTIGIILGWRLWHPY